MTDTPKIYAAIHAVQADLGGIAKNGRGPSSQSSYPFLMVDDIVAKLSPLFQEHGVVVRTEVLEELVEVDFAKKASPDGTPIYDGRVETIRQRTRVKVQWTFIAIEDGSEFPVITTGEAHDSGDKSINKAMTACYKQALLRTFTVVSGEQESDHVDPAVEQEAVQERRNRGAQRIDKARPAAGRTTARREAPKVPAPEPEESATPEPERAPEPEPTITKAAAEQQDATWRPDPEDVAYAEEKAPKAAVLPETKEEVRGQTIGQLKNDLRRAWTARNLSRDDVNALGRKLTGKEPTEFLFNITDLERIKKAVEAGEVA